MKTCCQFQMAMITIERPPRPPCFLNKYFKFGLLAWQANMDGQPIISHYKVITYM